MRSTHQRGFSLLELMLAMSIMLALAAGAIWYQGRTNLVSKAQGQGDTLLALSNALNTYATVNFTPLVNNTAVAGVASKYAPTVAELRTLGFLTSTFSATNLYGGGYELLVELAPGGCVAPNCDLATLANLTAPILDPQSQRVDTSAIGAAAIKAGGNAGYSSAAAPGTISGLGGAWSHANPAGAVAGILAIRGGYGASGLAQFTRRDGSAPPTGPWDMANINVTNINGLGSKTLTNSAAATVGGTLGVTGLTTTNGVTNNGALTNNGAASITGITNTRGITNTGSITNTGNISNGGDVITGRLWLQTIVVNGAACTGLNGYQAATAAGSIASCINGIWTTPNATVTPPPPCPTKVVTWGSGCNGTIAGDVSGATGWVNASYGTGSATFVCNSGNWLFQSGTCAIPCSGTYSWGGGICSQSYNLSSGSSTTVTPSNTSGPRGGTYGGSATIQCNNGSVTPVGTPTCTYSNAQPTLYNSQIPAQSDLQLASNPTSVGSYCSAVLPGSTGSYSTVDRGQVGLWTCWNNSGYNCSIPMDGSNCNAVNGCSCWNFAPANGGSCYTVTNLLCTRTGP